MTARFLFGAAALALITSPAAALDMERFEALVGKTVAAIDSEQVDVEELYRYQNELIDLGISGVYSFANRNADHAAAMDFVATSAQSMKALNLVEIETEWHEGGALKAAGIETQALYEDDEATTYMEAVIHPATAYIAVRAYEVTGDTDYLDQVKFELEEIVDHFEDIK